MQVFTPKEVTRTAANKYLAVLVASKYARVLNDFPKTSTGKEKKLTTRALEEISAGAIDYRVVPRKKPTE
jgi:DNA-directed RNA polymerase subunit K/omega